MNTKANEWKQVILWAREEYKLHEQRLLSKEKFARAAGLYYAGMTALSAVLGLIYAGRHFHALSAVLSVATAIAMMHLCSQKYILRAQKLHVECASLRRLAYEMEHNEGDDALYTQLLGILSGGDGVSAQEKRELLRRHDRETKKCMRRDEFVPELFGYEKFLYWLEEIAGILWKGLAFVLPAVCFVLTAVGVL